MARLVPANTEEEKKQGGARLVDAGGDETNPIIGSDPLRQLALGSRAVATGSLSLPLLAGDALNSAINYGIKGVNYFGGNVPYLPMASQSFDATMTKAGAPEPSGAREKLVYELSKGGAAGMTFPTTNPSQVVPALQGVSGSISGGVTQGAENMGAHPLLASGLGMAASMGVPSSPDVLMAAGRGTKAAASPFYQSGREQVVGDALVRMATQPRQALMNISGAPDDVSRLTTAQASKDPGLLATERALANLPGSGGRFANRYADQNESRRGLFNSMARSLDDLKAAESRRSAEAEKLYERAFATGPLKPTEDLIAISKRPAFEAAAKKAMEIAGNEGLDLGSPLNTMRGLHYLKKGVDDLVENAKPGTNEHRSLTKMKNDLLAVMDDLSPDYKVAREKFAEASKPINQMELLQDLRKRSMNSGLDVKGNRMLSQSKFTSVVMDNMEDLKKTLTPQQIENLKRISTDLDYGRLSDMGGKVSGSNTFQNISVANLLGSVLGKEAAESPTLQSALRPLGFLYKLPERQVEELMIEAMLDPKLAIRLMSRASHQNVEQLAKGLKERMAASARGGAAAQFNQ